jgi:hypothetical protein
LIEFEKFIKSPEYRDNTLIGSAKPNGLSDSGPLDRRRDRLAKHHWRIRTND